MADDTDYDGSTERRTCTLAAITIRRLERLARLGTHGTSVSKVMSSLIDMGIREAIEKNYIPLDT